MIKLNSANGFNPSELSLLNQALARVNALFQDPSFQAKVRAITNFSYTTDTPDVIAQKLANMNVSVDFFIFWPSWWKRHFSSEIAYEDSQGVHFDKNKYDAESFPEICNTVAHECTHAMGYLHPYERSVVRDNSVPYQIGQLVESIVDG